jgi:inner membrane protein
MDNATHAFAGLLLADATSAWIARRSGTVIKRRLQRIIVGVGVVAAELPDADLLYSGRAVGMGKLGYLLHHRGHTHTLVFAILAAFAIWWVARALRGREADNASSSPLLALALAGTLSHIVLDYSNSYGVHPLWPLDNHWYYGDAVFIAEPWLWLVAIPPLMFGPRRLWSRVLLGALLALLLVAAWTLGELPRALAVVVTISSAVWMLAQRWIPTGLRTTCGIGAWLLMEAVFATSSVRARSFAQVALAPDERVVDVVLTPAPANPFCFNALVVAMTNDTYRVRSATVAPWATTPGLWHPAAHCLAGATQGRFGARGRAITVSIDPHVRWGEEWSAPRAELRALSASRCAVAAALRFMRVPIWTTDTTGMMQLVDARFGIGGDGFAGLRVAAGPCELGARAWVPPWVPPRADLLE